MGRGAKQTVRCKRCQCQFEARVADVKRGWGKFCSKSCKAVMQEKKTGQFADYKARERCREEYGFTPVYFSADGGMYDSGGQGVDKDGNSEFIFAHHFDNTQHQNSGD